jgi:hypothetical protein
VRSYTLVIIVGLGGAAVADPLNAMGRLDAASPACGSSCTAEQTKVVPNLGKVIVWHSEAVGDETWTLTIQNGSDTWESPAISAPRSDCGAGHCNDTKATAVLHVFHPHGRVAVALEVQIETEWYVNEAPRRSYRVESTSSLIACGSSADGVRRCTTFDAQGCAIRLADNGTITRTCTDRVDFDAT